MAGSNVIAAYYGGTGRNQILSQTLASGTETEFKLGNDSASTSLIAVLNMPTQTQILGAVNPIDQTANASVLNSGFNQSGYFGDSTPAYNSGVFDGSKPFLVRLAGTYTPLTGTSSVSIDFKLYLGATKAATKIADTGAVANTNAAGASFNFILEAQLSWSAASQAVRGQFWFDAGLTGGYTTWAALSNPGASITSVSGLQFCASTTWGAVNGGTVAVSEFSLSRL